jgi:hypothetical protein
MANLIRSAKSGSDWSSNELLAYNIEIKDSDEREFFGNDMLPYEAVDETSSEYKKLMMLLNLVSRGQESAVDDFSRKLLEILQFEREGSVISSRFNIPLTISGDRTKCAQTDVCLVKEDNIVLLLLQEDKKLGNDDPEPQVIAEAIAAFQYNNYRRERYIRKRKLEEMIFPCITMVGTFPIFYLVPVTRTLSDSVITGQYPPIKTTVLRYIPGMKFEDNKEEILRYYQNFKILAEKYYSSFS